MSVAITLKQLEALYWIFHLGTFEKAALKLNTTQSAISKRIQELEAITRLELFDRSQRGARFTEKGEYLVTLAEEMLDLTEKIERLKDSQFMPVHKIRFGVTELSVLTWLPRFVSQLRQFYPTVILQPEVDFSKKLYEKLSEGMLDFIVIPEAFLDPEITTIQLQEVENVWMAKPGLVDTTHPVNLSQLAQYSILSQGNLSGSGLYFNKWFKSKGVVFDKFLSCDSMTALLGFAIAGLGVAYLPRQCFQPLVDEGNLEIIPVAPELPLVPYSAMYRNDRPSAIINVIAKFAKRMCDFSKQYQN